MTTQSNYVEVEVWCSIGLAGCEIVEPILVPREEWESMSEKDKEEYCKDVAFESFEWGWNEVPENG